MRLKVWSDVTYATSTSATSHVTGKPRSTEDATYLATYHTHSVCDKFSAGSLIGEYEATLLAPDDRCRIVCYIYRCWEPRLRVCAREREGIHSSAHTHAHAATHAACASG
jgi:hypothetical protein